ncbi:hypothetical protein [Actinokineospora sp. NBRC 105648]|uniref:hypothetical protein n=1 Tax=Actinokineospora sp. NBRC 105648 TaxID=3032206 RepID=UPI0024A58CCE|nr:hypothetical protein [Actinokineospora sp. NBRC 105648]GLZ41934.1 hypothetical protein Acsp05_55580 [Actinokineospora sp. NBRC 105648]
MTDRLGHKQIAAMFTLMSLSREVSNPELQDLVGFTLVGADRRRLNDLQLVASRKQGRLFVHELTDSGWAWCDEELGAGEAPAPRSSLGVALYILLGGLDRYLRREKLRLADVFTPDVELTADEIESRIRTAYRKLAPSPRDWVGLVDLRPMLGDAPTRDVDAVLKELSRTGQAHLIPEANRKTITAADRDAAVRIGGEDNHLLSIEAS